MSDTAKISIVNIATSSKNITNSKYFAVFFLFDNAISRRAAIHMNLSQNQGNIMKSTVSSLISNRDIWIVICS